MPVSPTTTASLSRGFAALLVVALAAVVLAAPDAAAGGVDGEPGVVPKPNPAPKTGYEIAFAFADVPGRAPEAASAFARYEVANRECVPVDHARAPGGVRLPPLHRMDLALERAPSGAFTTRVYEDAFADADLFGLGDCRWRLDGVTFQFSSPATQFVATVTVDELRAGQPIVLHYLARDLSERPPVGDYVFGEAAGHYLASLGPQFTLTLTPRRLP